MDLLTQGLLGATVAASTATARDCRRAALIGAVAGLLPDADALLFNASDPLFSLEVHRHFTHALIMAPVVALVAALLAWVPFRDLGFARIYRYALCGSALAGVLDACTSYGTHLWWPFADARVAWNLVSIIDPVVTLLLAAGLVAGLSRRYSLAPRCSMVLVAAYFGLSSLQHERALDFAREQAHARGHVVDRHLVKPTFGNIVVWRSVYAAGGHLFADGVRPGLFGPWRFYAGESLPLATDVRADTWGGGTRGARAAFERFAALADGWVVIHPARPTLLGDARFALLPTSLEPLWGIEVEAVGAAGSRLRFATNRQLTPLGRERFMRMLVGAESVP